MVTGVDNNDYATQAARFGIKRSTPKKIKPNRFDYIWAWYLELHRQRVFKSDIGIHEKLSWSDIWAWARLREIPLAAHEIDIISEIDALYSNIQIKNAVKKPRNH